MKRTLAVNRPPIHAPAPNTTKPNDQPTRLSAEWPMCATKGRANSMTRAAVPHQKYSSKPPWQARGAKRNARPTTAIAMTTALMKLAPARCTVAQLKSAILVAMLESFDELMEIALLGRRSRPSRLPINCEKFQKSFGIENIRRKL